MTTGRTPNLDLALPVEGELDGTWGDEVNNGITDYVDIAIAGTLTLTGDGAVTLANTQGAAAGDNIGATTAQYAILKITGTLSTTKVITAPSSSKTYVVINAATGGSVTVKASGQTGATVAVGERAQLVFNGTDYVKVSTSLGTGDVVGPASATDNAIARFDGTTGKLIQNSAVTVADTTGDITGGKYNKVTITTPATGSTLTIADGKTLTTNNSLTLAGTDGTTVTFPTAGVNFTTGLPVANGGTGATTLAANNVLLGNGTSALQEVAPGTNGNVLTSNGTTWTSATPTSSMVYPGAGIAVSTGSAWGTSKTSPTGDIVGTTDTQTLSNKRIDPRNVVTTSAASVTPDVSVGDIYAFTALAATLAINAPIGTPTDGDKLIFRFLDNGTPRSLNWNGTYTAIGVTLPTTTTANKTTYVGCIYNANNTRWDVIAVTTQA